MNILCVYECTRAWKTISPIIGRFGSGAPATPTKHRHREKVSIFEINCALQFYKFYNCHLHVNETRRMVINFDIVGDERPPRINIFRNGDNCVGLSAAHRTPLFRGRCGHPEFNADPTCAYRFGVSLCPCARACLHACVWEQCILYDLTHMHPIISVESIHNEICARASDSTIGTSV